jgi:hypothetical protein
MSRWLEPTEGRSAAWNMIQDPRTLAYSRSPAIIRSSTIGATNAQIGELLVDRIVSYIADALNDNLICKENALHDDEAHMRGFVVEGIFGIDRHSKALSGRQGSKRVERRSLAERTNASATDLPCHRSQFEEATRRG